MELKDFIGAIVMAPRINMRFAICQITSPEISVVAVAPNEHGYYVHYAYRTVNGDPISNGVLVFENPELTEPFKAAFKAYCRTEDAYWEEFAYWMQKD